MKFSPGGLSSRLILPRDGGAPRALFRNRGGESRDDGQPPLDGRAILSESDWRRVGSRLCLSPRELELVQHLFEGKKLLAVAQDMRLSLGTVKTYSQRIYQKVRVGNQRELILAVFSAHLTT